MNTRALAPRTTESVSRANRGNDHTTIKIDREGVIPTVSGHRENVRRAQAAKNRDAFVRDVSDAARTYGPLIGKLCISAPMAGVFSVYTSFTLGRSVGVDEASNVIWGHDTVGKPAPGSFRT